MRLHTGMRATLKMLNTKELSPSQQYDYLCVLGEQRNLDASGTSRLFHEGMLEHLWGTAAASCQAGTGHVQARMFPQQSVMHSEMRNSSPSACAPPRHFIHLFTYFSCWQRSLFPCSHCNCRITFIFSIPAKK